MKTCPRCGETKETDEFNRASSRSDGLQPYCRSCQRESQTAWAKENKERFYAGRKKQRERRRRLVWEYLQTHPCVDCGEVDPLVLEFDHVRGDKFRGISHMIREQYSDARLLEEIAKCDVRCANCHRRVTSERAGWWRSLVEVVG